MKRTFPLTTSLITLALATSSVLQLGLAQAPPFTGTWKGHLQINASRQLNIALEALANTSTFTGFFHSIDQQSYNYAIRKWGQTADTVWLRISKLGATINLRFAGDSAQGYWRQGKAQFPVSLARFQGDLNKPLRPQEPSYPLPYESKDVEVQATNGITLAGTITWPRTGTRFPAVLLVPGSGPSDRDQSIFGHKHFLVLADMLTRSGFAVLRMDDRGAGESSGNFASARIRDLADDAAAALQFLQRQPMVDSQQVGMIGHSLGAEIAGLTASEQGWLKWLVLLAGTAEPLWQNILAQTERIYAERGASQEAIDANSTVLKTVFDAARHYDNDSATYARLELALQSHNSRLQQIPAAALEKVELQPPLHAKDFASMLGTAMRYDLFYDPLPALKKLHMPLLVLNAKEDAQVLAYNGQLFGEALAEQVAQGRASVQMLSPANHLFQRCQRCTLDEYASIPVTIDPEYLATMVSWIENQMKR